MLYIYFELLVVFDCVCEGIDTRVVPTHLQTWHHRHQLLIATGMIPDTHTHTHTGAPGNETVAVIPVVVSG